MKNILYPFIIVMFFISINMKSQVNTDSLIKSNSVKKISLDEELEGTYQMIANDNKIVDVFTTDLLKIIESKREDVRDVIYQASQNTSIIIFSREKINSQEFKNRKK